MHIPHLFLIVFTLLLFVFIRYRIIFCNTHFIIIGLVYALSFTPQMPVLSLQFYYLLQVSLNKDIQSFHLQSLLATLHPKKIQADMVFGETPFKTMQTNFKSVVFFLLRKKIRTFGTSAFLHVFSQAINISLWDLQIKLPKFSKIIFKSCTPMMVKKQITHIYILL